MVQRKADFVISTWISEHFCLLLILIKLKFWRNFIEFRVFCQEKFEMREAHFRRVRYSANLSDLPTPTSEKAKCCCEDHNKWPVRSMSYHAPTTFNNDEPIKLQRLKSDPGFHQLPTSPNDGGKFRSSLGLSRKNCRNLLNRFQCWRHTSAV